MQATGKTLKNGELVDSEMKWIILGEKPNILTINVGKKTFDAVNKLLEIEPIKPAK